MSTISGFRGSPFAESLGGTLLHFVWQGSLIAALAWIALSIARSARARYAVACAALLLMPLVFGITLWVVAPHAGDASGAAGPAYSRLPDSRPVGPVQGATHEWRAYVQWAAPVWIAGVLCVLAWRAAAWIFALRLRRRGTLPAPAGWIARMNALTARMGVSKPVVLLESALTEVPVLIGYLRPAILVPLGMLAGLAPEQAEAILMHELAHIRRADYLVNMVQSAIEALLFYHPAVWWLSQVIRAEREHCSDDAVLEAQADPQVYASALLAIERNRGVELALAASDGDLLKRVRRVLRAPEAQDSHLPLIPAAIVMVALAIGLAYAQAPAADSAIPEVYKKWLNEDVAYIITDVEREGFKKLTNDGDREAFIKDFWLFRDPTPGTPENEFKEEHYRRIAYANNRFKESAVAGWKTDRGRIYIVYGPPDEIESHPSGSAEKAYPYEQWMYRLIAGIGKNVIVEFDDKNRTGEFHMTMDPNPTSGVKTPLPPGLHASVKVSAPGEVTISIPMDYADDVVASARAMNSSGFTAAWFEVPMTKPNSFVFVKKMNLAPGSYTLMVTVKDVKTGEARNDTFNVQVK